MRIAALLLLVACGREVPEPVTPPDAVQVEVGEDAGLGNVLAVQAWMQDLDYATADRFDARLRAWFSEARELGWLGPDTVVVLPEYIGTWLVAVDEPARVFRADQSDKALKKVVMSSLWKWMGAKKGARVDDRATYGLFALKSERMAEVYEGVLRDLAVDFEVTVVGGSILLPGPWVEGDRIRVTMGQPLRNVSFVFRPDGGIDGPIVKAYPTEDEQGFLTAGHPVHLPVLDSPVGPLGVLVCADAWFPEAWEALAAAEVVVVPQYTMGEGVWTEPWGGYSGWPAPEDVDRSHVGELTEAGAWWEYGPTERSAGKRLMVTAPLRGRLWDLGSDGQARVRLGDRLDEAPLVDAPVLLNVWVQP